MTQRASQLHALMPEVAAMVGGIVRQVYCRDAYTITIEVRHAGENHFLQVCAEPGQAGAWMVDAKPRQPPEPTSFTMLLRKVLKGARVVSAAQVQDDRLMRIDVARRPSSGDAPDLRYTLMAEFASRSSNAFLLDEEGRIMGSVSDARKKKRALGQGQPYTCPPPPPDEVAQRSWRDPLDLDQLPSDGTRSQRMGAEMDLRAALKRRTAAAETALRRLERRVKFLNRRLRAVEADQRRAQDGMAFKRYGELLQAAYGREIPTGADHLDVPDYCAEGMPTVRVPIDPKLDLKSNIARCFKRYRKYKRAEATIQGRLDAAKASHVAVAAALEEARDMVSKDHGPLQGDAILAQLKALVTGLEDRGLLERKAPQVLGSRARSQAASPYRSFTSKTGKTILVGKGGRDNDTLSLKVARGSDLWLHAHNWAGAHVVVRLNRGEEVDMETLLDAATLAAHYSKGRLDTVVEVLYTRAKHVRKPKGTPAGRVTVAGSRTLAVRMEGARVARLFKRPVGD